MALVEKVRSTLDMKPVTVGELQDINVISIKDGEAHGLMVPLKDEKNENSCVLSYYEVGLKPNDRKTKLVNMIVMQYLNEPFFDDLRTKQQLGYVVFSRHHSEREVLNCQFLVQSPKKSCEYLVQQINEFLVATREAVKKLSDEDFEVQKQAVMTKLAEKDFNLQKESARFWEEIIFHHYEFNRQDLEIEALKLITKDEFVAHFEQIFFSADSKRLDIELTSAAHESENSELLESNKKHLMFTEVFKGRQIHTATIDEFKSLFELHPDTLKQSYAKM